MEDWQAVSRVVRERRVGLGLQQKELARLAGVDPSTIRNLEHARRSSYAATTLAKVSRALSWPADLLTRVAGGEPVDVAVTVEHDDLHRRLADLERQVDTLEQRVARLARELSVLRSGADRHATD